MATDTKIALLNSAERAARTRGVDGFSYADLAADVGIRKSSIHHHFPTKAAMTKVLMQRYIEDLQSACVIIDKTQATGGKRLSALIDRYRKALDGGQSLCLCVALSTSRESLPKEVIGQIVQFRATMIDWLHSVFLAGQVDGSIAEVQNPKAEAAAALSLLEGAQLAARAEESTSLFEAAVELMKLRIT